MAQYTGRVKFICSVFLSIGFIGCTFVNLYPKWYNKWPAILWSAYSMKTIFVAARDLDLHVKMAETSYDMDLSSHSFIFVYNESEFPLKYMFHILTITPTRADKKHKKQFTWLALMMDENMMLYKTLTGGILDCTSRMTNCANRQNQANPHYFFFLGLKFSTYKLRAWAFFKVFVYFSGTVHTGVTVQ